ncbi:hypothetical protein [Nannocystis pusilla]
MKTSDSTSSLLQVRRSWSKVQVRTNSAGATIGRPGAARSTVGESSPR